MDQVTEIVKHTFNTLLLYPPYVRLILAIRILGVYPSEEWDAEFNSDAGNQNPKLLEGMRELRAAATKIREATGG